VPVGVAYGRRGGVGPQTIQPENIGPLLLIFLSQFTDIESHSETYLLGNSLKNYFSVHKCPKVYVFVIIASSS
jgi:hypothetical protein